MEKLYELSLVYSLILVIGCGKCQLAEEARSIALKIPVSPEEILGWKTKQK